MDEPGPKLKRTRERLGLKYRDVEEFSFQIAERHKNSEFNIAISRLADIENRNVVPSLYKLYSLCAIYRLEISEVLRWYEIDLGLLATDSASVVPAKSHVISFGRDPYSPILDGQVQVPLSLDPGIDISKTTFLSRFIQSWGSLPLMLIAGLNLKNHLYGFVGLDDYFMYPLLQPGSLVMIDESKRKVASGGWTSEFDRPIYFLESRDGWFCGWCSLNGDTLTALPHPVSGAAPIAFSYLSGVEVLGQVTGVANRLDPSLRPRIRP